MTTALPVNCIVGEGEADAALLALDTGERERRALDVGDAEWESRRDAVPVPLLQTE